ncbi:uncharacterized protein LOC105693552 [Athalia rosae]|uniref:uncharacterized protein LOC105693552 n=1 Tax=Athalia rosae TaxID=37344 RepID=UPI0020336F8C|nr:uncharacterized protein LOC105693552 [Athalia rosae]
MSKSSKTSIRSYGKQGTRKKVKNCESLWKPFGFCCNINNSDNETRYDQRRPPFTSSLVALSPIHGSPTLNFHYQYTEPAAHIKRKVSKGKSKSKDWNLEGNPCVLTGGPLLWYQEDEIEIAKNQFWEEKQMLYNKEADRNALIGEKKVKTKFDEVTDTAAPRWYQDLSILQMKQVLALGETMTADYEETITVRTQNALATIGVTSTLFKIAPQIIKKLQRSTRLEPIQFLREIYKKVTGQYFEDEEYKKTYDCNERIILSAIAFLALPNTVIALNKRLPWIKKPVFPSKPDPPQTSTIRRGLYKSPYQEPLFGIPDWVTYRKSLDKWYEKCKLVPRPRVILPQLKTKQSNNKVNFEEMNSSDLGQSLTPDKNNWHDSRTEKQSETNLQENEKSSGVSGALVNFSVPSLPGGDKQTFDFTFSGLGESPGPVNYKICGTLNPPFPKRKSWLGEKEAHYVVSGIWEHEDPPQCPVTYVMTGISSVTPDNSDEQFFAELKLGDGPQRVYPAGRKNLSKNWQEWLQDADEEFLKVEREANKLIKSVKATMKLVIPENRCDACCSCRQTRKTNLKEHATKSPYLVIDSIAVGDNQDKYIVGSLALHSPAPSPEESTVNLLEVIASRETLQKKLVINGITNDNGETTYYISGVIQETERIPKTTVFHERPPKPLRNVPPCACTIEQMFNEKIIPSASGDNIPQTKKKGICFGRKYRPNESPAFTCKEYPDDKSCRRNPFDNKLKRGIPQETDDSSDGPPGEKKMFTLPAFSPCGDEDGMAVCGGPWGTKNVTDPKVLAAREAEAKELIRSAAIAASKARKAAARKDEDDEDTEEEEDSDDEKRKKLSPRELAKIAKEEAAAKEKLRRSKLKRDKLCSERFTDETDVIDDDKTPANKSPPVYCDFDNPWNRMRTAPTVNPWENEYECSLKLTQPVSPSSEHESAKKGTLKITEGTLKLKKGNDGGEDKKNHDLREKRDKNRSNDGENYKKEKDKVEIIYGGKQVTTRPQESREADSKRNLSSGLDSKPKKATQETSRSHLSTKNKTLKVIDRDSGKSRAVKEDLGRKRKSLPDESEPGKLRSKKPMIKNDCGNGRHEDWAKINKRLQPHKLPRSKSNAKSEKLKSVQATRSSSPTRQPRSPNKIDEKSTDYIVRPAIIPTEQRLPCQRENMHLNEQLDDCECSHEKDQEGIDAVTDSSTGPFGWRTESQQKMPREKTLVYLTEPDNPVEMIKVRKGGRPCMCRENRNKKKILLYSIGGQVSVGKGKRGMNQAQLIEGVTYVTPPQSQRNSSEYIPEYELFESPYKSCVRKQSDKKLKYLQKLSTPCGLRSLRDPNTEPCPCGLDVDGKSEKTLFERNAIDSSLSTSASKRKSWSAAIKDEGLIDYFANPQDSVPCWLKCAKFDKPGCCIKPKLLQVKKPVCECRYERRVVRREEEKQKWVDRQRRLKDAKKEPYLQVEGTSRPMQRDTKLMISSVKKVLRDGEFIPETQYCVSGVAENYCMGPVERIIPGITMQSPVITPEPSKPDILCMCGHRHWSPMDVRADKTKPEDQSVRPKGDYPCRGREQQEITGANIAMNCEKRSTDSDNNLPSYTKSCGDSGGASIPGIVGKRKSTGKNKSGRNLDESPKQDTKKLTFHMNKKSATGARDEKLSKRETENFKSTGVMSKYGNVHDDIATQDISSHKDETNLFDLMKMELKKMANEDFILAKLPESWSMPQLKSWIEYREGKVYNYSMKEELCEHSKKTWAMMEQRKKPIIPPPSLGLRPAKVVNMTFDQVDELKKKIPIVKAKYYSQLRKMRVSEARSYWHTMEFGKFPSLSFKETYFTYMPGKEADGHVFRPWKLDDSKER